MAPRLFLDGKVEKVTAHKTGEYSARVRIIQLPKIKKINACSFKWDKSRIVTVSLDQRQYEQYKRMLDDLNPRGFDYVSVRGSLTSKVEEDPPF